MGLVSLFYCTLYFFKIVLCAVNLSHDKKKSSWKYDYDKFVLKSVKSLNRILWARKYWFKALKCQIWLTNTKPFFWESEANVKILQNCGPYIWVSYKFVLKSVKSLNRILWATEYLFKALKCQICWRIQNHFSGKVRQTLKLSKIVVPIFEFPINLFWSLSKV